jgi:hypothetical protein
LHGTQADELDELSSKAANTVIIFEFEAYPEPKILTPIELKALYGGITPKNCEV